MNKATTIVWATILSCVLFFEILGSTLMGRGLPLPYWYALLSWATLILIALLIGVVRKSIETWIDSKWFRINLAIASFLLSLLITTYKINQAGGLSLSVPLLMGSIVFLGPLFVMISERNGHPAFWIGLPFFFLSLGGSLHRSLFRYWTHASKVPTSFSAYLTLILSLALVLYLIGSRFNGIEQFVNRHTGSLTITICLLFISSIFLWTVTAEPIQWEFHSTYKNQLPSSNLSKKGKSSSAPNLFLISVDTVRFDQVGNHGGRSFVPQLLEDGINLKKVISTSGWTLPSHASLFTGLLPYRHGAIRTGSTIDRSIPTFTQYLRKHGYQTAAFTDGGLVDKNYGFGRGFDQYWEQTPVYYKEYVPGMTKLASLAMNRSKYKFLSHYSRRPVQRKNLNYARLTFKKAKSWLENQNEDSPVFLFTHTYQAHDYWKRFPEGVSKLRQNHPELAKAIQSRPATSFSEMNSLSDTVVTAYEKLYQHEVKRSLRQVRQFLEYLRENDLYKNSYVVLLSDHGEGFSLKSDILGHGHGQLDEVLIKVPVIVKTPHQQHAGETIDKMISIKDLFPIVLKDLGLKIENEFYQHRPGLEELLGDEYDGRNFTHGSTIHHNEGNHHYPKLFVRSDNYLFTKILGNEFERTYRIISNSPYQKKTDSLDKLLKRYETFTRRFKEESNPYNKQKDPLTSGEKEMLKGMGYL